MMAPGAGVTSPPPPGALRSGRRKAYRNVVHQPLRPTDLGDAGGFERFQGDQRQHRQLGHAGLQGRRHPVRRAHRPVADQHRLLLRRHVPADPELHRQAGHDRADAAQLRHRDQRQRLPGQQYGARRVGPVPARPRGPARRHGGPERRRRPDLPDGLRRATSFSAGRRTRTATSPPARRFPRCSRSASTPPPPSSPRSRRPPPPSTRCCRPATRRAASSPARCR